MPGPTRAGPARSLGPQGPQAQNQGPDRTQSCSVSQQLSVGQGLVAMWVVRLAAPRPGESRLASRRLPPQQRSLLPRCRHRQPSAEARRLAPLAANQGIRGTIRPRTSPIRTVRSWGRSPKTVPGRHPQQSNFPCRRIRLRCLVAPCPMCLPAHAEEVPRHRLLRKSLRLRPCRRPQCQRLMAPGTTRRCERSPHASSLAQC